MTLDVMDTDHLSLFERNHPSVVSCVLQARQSALDDLSTTVISMQEQLEGRLAQIRRAKDSEPLSLAYVRLKKNIQTVY